MAGGVLSIGDTGDDVRRWQQYLLSQGYRVATDGRFGPSTLAATKQVQRKLGVMPDGRVGHHTTDRQAQTMAQPLPVARPDPVQAAPPVAPPLAGVAGTGSMGGGGMPAPPMGVAGGQADIPPAPVQPFVDASGSAGAGMSSTAGMSANVGGVDPSSMAALLQTMGIPNRPNPAFDPSRADFIDNAPNMPEGGSMDQQRHREALIQALGARQQAPIGLTGSAGSNVGMMDPTSRDQMIRMLLQQAQASGG